MCDVFRKKGSFQTTFQANTAVTCDWSAGPINLVPLFEDKLVFTLSFPIFNLVQVQFIWSFGYWWSAVLPNSFYPVTDITNEEKRVTQAAHYPVTFLVLVYNFLCTCTMLYCIYIYIYIIIYIYFLKIFFK